MIEAHPFRRDRLIPNNLCRTCGEYEEDGAHIAAAFGYPCECANTTCKCDAGACGCDTTDEDREDDPHTAARPDMGERCPQCSYRVGPDGLSIAAHVSLVHDRSGGFVYEGKCVLAADEDGEYPDRTIRQNGPIVIGQRCPWCGAMVTDADHTKGHD